MPTWTDYKNYIRKTNPEIAKDIDETEAISKNLAVSTIETTAVPNEHS